MDIFSTTGVSSVLGGATTSATGSNMAAVTSAQGKRRLNTDLQTLGDSYSGRFRDLADETTSTLSLQAGISAAVDSLRGAKSSADSLANLFTQMLATVETAKDPADAEHAAAQFQAQMMTLRSMTSSSTGNLLSGPDQRIDYDLNVTGTRVEILGQNMGASYTIVASDGNVWAPDQYGTGLTAYTAYPSTPANMSSGFQGGTRLNSLSGSTIDFTVQVNTASPVNLTGTLSSKGSGVFDSWMYDDLSTADGIERATAALTAAKGMAVGESFRYSAAEAMAQYYNDKFELQVSAATRKQTELTEEQALKAADLEDKFKQSQAALALAFQTAALSGVQLIGIIPSSNSVLSTTASSQPMFDVFA